MANDMARLGAATTARRRELGLSQIEVWQQGGPSNSTLTRIENGQGDPPSASTLKKLDAALSWEPGSAARTLAGGSPVVRLNAIERLAQMGKEAGAATAAPLAEAAANAEYQLIEPIEIPTATSSPRAHLQTTRGSRPTTFGDLEDLHARIERLTPDRAATVSRYVDDLLGRQENDQLSRVRVSALTDIPLFGATGDEAIDAMRTAEEYLDQEFYDTYGSDRVSVDEIKSFASVALAVQQRLRGLVGQLLQSGDNDGIFGSVIDPSTVTDSTLDEADDIDRRVATFVGRLVHTYRSPRASVARIGMDLYKRVAHDPSLVPYLTDDQLDEIAAVVGERQQRLLLPGLDRPGLSVMPDRVAASDRGTDAKHPSDDRGEESQDPGTDDPA